MPLDNAGNTLGTARGITVTPTTQTYSDYVDTLDNSDCYRFSLGFRSSFNLGLNALTGNADVRLIQDANSNGTIDSGDVLTTSNRTATLAESISTTLNAGSYFIQVYPNGNVSSNYNLSVSATPVDSAGNTVSTARNITINSTSTTYTDWVGSADTTDFYRFSLTNNSSFALSMNGLATDADVQLLRLNSDNTTTVVGSSTNGGNTSEAINIANLVAGTYLARVYQYSGDTVYNLSLSASTIPVDNAGNTLPTARQITVGATSTNYTDWVGTADTTDIYGFNLTDTRNFALTLGGLSGNANVDLLDSNGNVLQTGNNAGTIAEAINRQLTAGSYYIRVTPSTGVNTNYQLTVSAAIPTVDWFSQYLKDQQIRDLTRSLAADGNLSRNDMLAIFRNAGDLSVIDANELTDLRTLLSNSSRFTMQDYVRILSDKVVNGDIANTRSGIANLAANSTATQMENLIGKWFLGTSRPTTTNSNYTYRLASGSLFQNGISYQDVNQGNVGNCYFLAGLAGTALRSPSTIQSMFIDNGDNTFTVRFYTNGTADYVTVDKYLPSTSDGKFIYAHQTGSNWGYLNSSTNELWVALAEKAYAQINESGKLLGPASGVYANSYASIVAGYNSSITDITGRTTVSSGLSSSDFNAIVTAVNEGRWINFGSNGSGTASNIVYGHAYVLTSYNSSTQKFTLFNPWGVGNSSNKPGIIELSFSELISNFGSWTRSIN